MCGILLLIDGVEGTKIKHPELLEELISRRGPDYNSLTSTFETTCGLKIQAKASILHLRGDTIQKQPVRDEQGNILLFNGQIYELSNKTLEEKQSDTTILFKRLRQCRTTVEIASIFSSIDGPFAFIYWHNDLNTLMYGRDIFGRKSLCQLQNDTDQMLSAISSVAYQNVQSVDKSNISTWSEVDCSGFHCLQFNSSGQLSKRIKFIWQLDNIYPPTDKCQSVVMDSEVEYVTLQSSPLSSLNRDLRRPEEFSEEDQKVAVDGLEEKLLQAVKKRIKYNRQTCLECRKSNSLEDCKHSKVAVAFSGGIDSTLLALALHKVIHPQETIDLTTVAFKDASPDRGSVGSAFRELRDLCPDRNWRLILCDVSMSTLQHERKNVIRHLICPCNTVVDDSLGCGCWFISRAEGRAQDSLIDNDIFDRTIDSFLRYNTSDILDERLVRNYTSPATIFFAGMGIDEQLGGYSSHRAAWSSAGIDGTLGEICKQMRRISSRNLGRDDRTCSHHGRDVKLPYLDFDLVSYLNELPVGLKMNLNEPLGVGPKKLLRQLAFKWGLRETGARVKRALQFGTRIANLEGLKEYGNEICSRLIQE